jgi:hypothetical protein
MTIPGIDRTDTAPLTGPQFAAFTEALVEAFPTPARLTRMIRFRFGKNLAALAIGEDLIDTAFKLVTAANAEGWARELIVGARQSNPGNPSLFRLAQDLDVAVTTPPDRELEGLIKKSRGFLDIVAWRERLTAIEHHVCRIHAPIPGRGMKYGTGFLVAKDVVITNHHIIAAARPSDIVCEFDFKRIGGSAKEGSKCRLATSNWLIDSSPISPVDLVRDPKPGAPGRDQLDYALLRLDEPIAKRPLGRNAEPRAPRRGWIDLDTIAPSIAAGEPLFIVQHPAAAPLALAFDPQGILGENDNGTRVKYLTNTLPGSSGAPCFDINWRLVALHHSGARKLDASDALDYNEGIPLSAIVNLLRERNIFDQLH